MMKKGKKALSIALLLALGLTACGSPAAEETQTPSSEPTETSTQQESVSEAETPAAETEGDAGDLGLTTEDITLTMSWWGGESRAEATMEALDKFMEKYPNITVEATFGAWSGWEDAMGLAFATDTAQDIVQINWNWIYNFGANGNVFVDLYEYEDVLDISQFPESAVKASELDGKLQAVPVALTARTMYWNKNVFDKAGIEIPSTWDEFLASGEVFKEKLGDDYYPLYLNEYDRMIFMVWYLESMYNKPWVENGQVQYTQEEIQEGFAMLKDLEDRHVLVPIQLVNDYNADPIEQSERWINGYWAGIHTWTTSMTGPQALALPEDQRDGFVVTPMFEGLPYKGGFNKISMEFAITQTCEHPREAAALINFLLNEEEGVIAMKSERGTPVSATGFQIASENGILDQMTIDSTNMSLNQGWNQFNIDPYFEHSDLKNDPEGAYYKIMSAHSYQEIDDAEAAAQLLEAVTGVLTANAAQ
ncbi:MAG TPA: ABC transporter substrate-binding protein [Candidatus Acetatifactor stercoripullorum]|uniref:ABC transporter substrate-binding protein n=1 Tax=Candidatus Acetatifactor stercoripullorum TaxID=2838414 RepID=A0A9D1UC26_9FIRM|nr:ABC transporter substrate-binding protein [uncultured Acetatifactor sp.]HIW80940.1 ABC transporter substrate-binding protein [Candidatus Acetatifactor stercoripullorum]